MIRRVTFNSLAELELNEAARYYEGKSPGLGAAFLKDAQRSVESTVELPEAGSIIQREIRWRHLVRFPYALLYKIKEDGIRILAVMHTKRRPMYWIGRD